MPNTWSHLCNANNSFYTLPLNQECKVCKTDYRVQAMRYAGYFPASGQVLKKTASPLKSKIAALLKPKVKQQKLDEHQDSYYDRQG